jgi:hypothetical protein
MNTTESKAHSLRVQLEANKSRLDAMRRNYAGLAFAAQSGDASAKSEAQELRGKIEALAGEVAEQQAALEGAQAAIDVERVRAMGDAKRDAFARANRMMERRVDHARQIEAKLAELAALVREYDALGDASLASTGPHLGDNLAAAVAPARACGFVLSRLIGLAGWIDDPNASAPPIACGDVRNVGPLDQHAEIERARLAQRAPAPKLEAQAA